MNKKELTEADIRTKFITPALVGPGGKWNVMTQVREEIYFTKGRVIVRGKMVKLDQFPSPPTTHVWYYEHPYPPGAKSYNKGKPIRIEEFEGERAWWGKPDKSGAYSKRVENEQAWRVSIDQIKAGNFNLDLKNPHNPDTGPGDMDHLLPEYEKLLEGITRTRAALKRELALALGANGKEKE